ncbi:hypothetical protein [Floridanema aerugineum]|jgi:hypothetical protein|uniref:Uncharacterized protein n=1 Tax=Floridaenema aerugineum BLCC-F46 TaxID=3153654 RepID=A0ABV4X6S0_9CYAN
MESLAYIHMAFEYEKSLPSQSNYEQFCEQQQSKNPPIKVHRFLNWLPFKLFKCFSSQPNSEVVTH